MTTSLLDKSSENAGPAWEIATLFPDQGEFSEGDYLSLTQHTNRLIEFTDGRVEVLPVPTTQHQLILSFVYQLLHEFVSTRGLGLVLFAALRVKIRERLFREPDIVFMAQENLGRAQNEFWIGADLVVEVVSPHNPERDLVEKRAEYARAKIPEYWIVDPRFNRITVLTLSGIAYVTASEASENGTVASVLLPGLEVDVQRVFSAGKIG